MKKLSLSIVALLFSGLALAETPSEKHNYRCIADVLQAYNSSIYYDLSPEEIDVYLYTDRWAGAEKVREVARLCDAENTK